MSLCLFQLIEFVFRSIEIVFKNFKGAFVCFDQSKMWIRFLKNWIWRVQFIFFKTFSNFLSLSNSDKLTHHFCCFPPKFLRGFPLSKPVSLFYPSFCIYFHIFMHKFMHFVGIFGPIQIWGFWRFKPSFLKLIIGFCSYNIINMIYDV